MVALASKMTLDGGGDSKEGKDCFLFLVNEHSCHGKGFEFSSWKKVMSLKIPGSRTYALESICFWRFALVSSQRNTQ